MQTHNLIDVLKFILFTAIPRLIESDKWHSTSYLCELILQVTYCQRAFPHSPTSNNTQAKHVCALPSIAWLRLLSIHSWKNIIDKVNKLQENVFGLLSPKIKNLDC